MKNTEGLSCGGGSQPPRAWQSDDLKWKEETEVSPRLINFVFVMYKQLTSEQRYTISVLLQQDLPKKEIATAINQAVYT